jgi:tRNA A-37 threonylcarbamoyl transferase component Bud32
MTEDQEEPNLHDEILLGNILLKNKSITPTQLRQALVKQEENATTGHQGATLGELLLSLNFITTDDLQRALRVQRANLRKNDFVKDEKKARLLGKEAVDMGLLTYEQLEECINKQTAINEQQDVKLRLGEILVQEGFATEEQILELIEFQKGVPSAKISKVLKNQGQSINLNLEMEHYTSLDSIIKNESHGNKHMQLYELGQGGNGKIILCIDAEVRRYVAMKVMHDLHKPSKVQQARFLEEIQITGQLEHPNIVPIHEVGVDEAGNLFFTMKYVTGENLEDHIAKYHKNNKDSTQRQTEVYFLNILIKICDAIKFAHAKGVIHRDIKPENIMIGEFGEVLLMDWGSAKVKGSADVDTSNVVTIRKDTNVLNTLDGTMIGTPLYMSPEQALGAINEYDIRTDVFGVGAVLFKMLTNQPPAKGTSEEEVLRDVVHNPTPNPKDTERGKHISREVQHICMQAIAREKEDRYQTIEEMQIDITQYIQDGTVETLQYNIPDHISHYFENHTKHAIAIITIIAIAIIAYLLK